LATYNIGDKSLIFKRVSMFLQETYMSSLEVSDEYTLDLAKCIYEYLRDFYPNRYKYYFCVSTIPSDFLSVMDFSSNFGIQQTKYYVRSADRYTNKWLGSYEPAPMNSTWADNTFYVEGPEYSIADIYTIGMQTGLLGDGTAVYNKNFPGIYTYKLLGYTKDIIAASDVTKLTDEQKIYSLNETTKFLQILENPELEELYKKYAEETSKRQSNKGVLSDREYNRIKEQIRFIEEQRDYFAKVPSYKSADSDILQFVTDGLSQVNKYNIASWPINEAILQFLTPDIVITEQSNEDDIAQMQVLARALDYNSKHIGLFDENFKDLCKHIQIELSDTDKRVIVNSYCDIFVERYLRAKNDVRTEVY
jgi:hypothetical protein